jgi:hypothetical protein
MTFSVSPAGGKHGRGGPAACGISPLALCHNDRGARWADWRRFDFESLPLSSLSNEVIIAAIFRDFTGPAGNWSDPWGRSRHTWGADSHFYVRPFPQALSL